MNEGLAVLAGFCHCGCGGKTTISDGTDRRRGWIKGRPLRWILGHHTERHGATSKGVRSPEYLSWIAMRQRCNNHNHAAFHAYGGRGITVCERWASFENFLADMGPRPSREHTLDRIKNDEGYSPGNCRWATWTVQNHNRRSTRLNPEAVKVIRFLAAGEVSKALLAKLHKISLGNTAKVVNRRAWKSVGDRHAGT